MKPWNKRGNVLLFVIVGMTAITVLGTGIYFMTTTSNFSGLSANDQNRAYQLAVAGKEYALAKNLGNTGGRDFTLTKDGVANGDKFNLVISGDNITSTGIVREGTPYEARRTITVINKGFSSQADVSFKNDIQSFTSPTQSRAGFITTDTTAGTISLGKISMSQTFGALLYKGNNTAGNCMDGKCSFLNGLRAFFVFQFASDSKADGFTFAVFNGSNHTASSVGGYTGRGELMGYAGNSYTGSTYLDGTGSGIQPPKIAVEFDPYYNACNAVCTSDEPTDGSRCDEYASNPNNKNHMALVFWGSNTSASCGSTADDNRHEAGGGTNETFSNAPNPTQGTYNQCYYFDGNKNCTGSTLPPWPGNWLLDTELPNIYAFRLEISRKSDPETSGDHQYRIKAWIKKCNSGDTTCTITFPDSDDYTNTKTDYTVGNPPIIDRTIEMSPDYHTLFDTMFLGWTTATGGLANQVNLSRFRINFQK